MSRKLIGKMPSAQALAARIRNERLDVVDLAHRYEVPVTDVMLALQAAGYSPATGNRAEPYVPTPRAGAYTDSAGGSGRHVGGTEPRGLPYEPVRHTQRRRQHTGLDWDALRPPGEPLRTSRPRRAAARRSAKRALDDMKGQW